MEENNDLLQFPCLYPLKVMGKTSRELQAEVRGIIERHIAEGHEVTYRSRTSSAGKYMSITITLRVESREQLNRLYAELNDHELITMVL